MSDQTISGSLEHLQREGYCVIRGLALPAEIAALESELEGSFASTPFCDGDFYGYRTKRFGGLLRRSVQAQGLALNSVVLALAHSILGDACDRIQLNVAQAIEIHPGEIEQFPHRDHDMWQGARIGQEFLLNVIWPISPFTCFNGATRIYPGTHLVEVADPRDLPAPVIAECEPGSAICFLGSTIHGAGPNHSERVRRAIVMGYSLGWLKPYENPWLAYPPEIARDFSPELAALAGYAQHRPNLGNYEGQCPSVLLAGDRTGVLQAIDALRPDQEAAVHEFAMARRSAP